MKCSGYTLVSLCCLLMLSGWVEAQGNREFRFVNGGFYFVAERDGGFDVCVELASGTINAAETITITLTGVDDTASAPGDYLANQMLMFNDSSTMQCVTVQAFDDSIVENVEQFFLDLTTSSPQVVFTSQRATVVVQDTSQIRLGFANDSFALQESSGETQVCVTITQGAVEAEVTVVVTIKPGTAGLTDYRALEGAPVTFSQQVNITCAIVTIEDDNVIEDNEHIIVDFSGSDVSLVSNANESLQVFIMDNDGATLSIVDSNIRIVEGNSSNTVTEICLSLVDTKNNLERDINITATASGITANTGDYESAIGPILFQALSFQGSISCVNVTIIGDTTFEPDESLSVVLTPGNPMDMISGPTSVTIVILNDDEPDCGVLTDPLNGSVIFNSTTVGSVAEYLCDLQFDLEPIEFRQRICEFDGVEAKWSVTEPMCQPREVSRPPVTTPVSANNNGRTIGLAVGLSVGGALIIVILVIVIAVLVVRRQHHYHKYVLPYKDYVRPYSVFANKQQPQQSEHGDISRWEAQQNRSSDYIVGQVLGESQGQSAMPDTQDVVADEPELLEYRTDHHDGGDDAEVDEVKIDLDDDDTAEEVSEGVPDEDIGEQVI